MGDRDFRFSDGFKGLCLLLNSSFRLNINEAELSYVSDIGELHSMISSRYSCSVPEGCLTSSVFYSLRKGLIACGVERKLVKRNSALVSLLPQENVFDNWSKLESTVGVGLLPLRMYSPAQFVILGSLAVGIGLICRGCNPLEGSAWPLICCGLGTAIAVGAACLGGIGVEDPDTVYFYPDYNGSVGQATQELLSFNFDELVRKNHKWSSKDLFTALQTLIESVSEHERGEITANTRFDEICFDDGP